MAAKRISKSAIDWKKFQAIIPQDQQPQLSQLMGKSFQYASRLFKKTHNSVVLKLIII